jgi:hypothetical protein
MMVEHTQAARAVFQAVVALMGLLYRIYSGATE